MNKHKIFIWVLTIAIMMWLTQPAWAQSSATWNAAAPDISTWTGTGNTVTIAAGASGTLNVPAGVEIDIIGGTVSNAIPITLNIGTGATVNWKATEYNGTVSHPITLTGAGEFNLTGLIQGQGSIVVIQDERSGVININSGGEVRALSGAAIAISNGALNVNNGGKATAASGNAINSTFDNANINVSGGVVSNNSGSHTIEMRIGSTLSVSGGLVENAGSGNAIDAHTVNISGGTIMGGTDGFGVERLPGGSININSSDLSTPIIVGGGNGAFSVAPTVTLPLGYFWRENYFVNEPGGELTNSAITPYSFVPMATWVEFKMLPDPNDPDPPAPDTALFAKTDETAQGANDGTISGITALMEWQYNATTEGSWTGGTGEILNNLAPGTYYVRFKETAINNASMPATIVIAAFVEDDPDPDTKGDGGGGCNAMAANAGLFGALAVLAAYVGRRRK